MASNHEYTYTFTTSNNWDWRLKIRTANNVATQTYTTLDLPSNSIRINSIEYGWDKAPIGIPENLTMDLTVNLTALIGTDLIFLKNKLFDSFVYSTSSVAGQNMFYNVFILETNYGGETFEVFALTAQKPTIERVYTPGEIIETLDIETICLTKLAFESTAPLDLNLGFDDGTIEDVPSGSFDYIFGSSKRIFQLMPQSTGGSSKIEAKSIVSLSDRISGTFANLVRIYSRNPSATFPTSVTTFLASGYDKELISDSVKFYRHLYNDTGKANFSSEITKDELFVATLFYDASGTPKAGFSFLNDSESWNMNYKNIHNALQDLTEGMFQKGVYKAKVLDGYYFGYIEFTRQLSDFDEVLNVFDLKDFDNLKIIQGMDVIRNCKFNIKERTGGNITEFEVDNRFSKAENDFNLKNITFNVQSDNAIDSAMFTNTNFMQKNKVVGSKLYSIEPIPFLSSVEHLVRVADGYKVNIDGTDITFEPSSNFDVSKLSDKNGVKIEIAKRQQQGSLFNAIAQAYLTVYGDYNNAEIEGTLDFDSTNIVGGSIARFKPYNIGKRIELIDTTNLTSGLKNTSGTQLVANELDDINNSKFTLKKVNWNFENETIDLILFAR